MVAERDTLYPIILNYILVRCTSRVSSCEDVAEGQSGPCRWPQQAPLWPAAGGTQRVSSVHTWTPDRAVAGSVLALDHTYLQGPGQGCLFMSEAEALLAGLS